MAKKSAPLIEDAKVLLYLIAVEPAMAGMFKLLNEPVPTVPQLRKRVSALENSILTFQRLFVSSNLIENPVFVDALEQLVRETHRQRFKAVLEQSVQSGHEGKAIVDASTAAGIIFLAHRCFELAGAAPKNDGRKVAGYTFKEFLHQARSHAAHFNDSKRRTRSRAAFETNVLKYNPPPVENHSAQCLNILGWKSWNDVHNDIRSLLL